MPRPHRPKGRRPDYDLKVFHKETEKNAYVGAAWLDPNTGRINIHLDLCVHLQHDPNVILTLFPVDRDEDVPDDEPKKRSRPRNQPRGGDPDDEPKPPPPQENTDAVPGLQ